MNTFGLYIISDTYFKCFPDKHMMDKNQNRPYYLVVKAPNDIIWLIPISSKVDKYKAAIARHEEKRGEGKCIFYYIAKIKGEERAVLIGNALPVTAEYIERAFTVNGVPYIVENGKDRKEIHSKFSKYLNLVRQGKLLPTVDILKIENALILSKER